MPTPYKGNWMCEVEIEGKVYTCYRIKSGAKNSRVIRCGLPRSEKNERVLPNETLKNLRRVNGAKDEKPVPDGKVFRRMAVYDGDEVYVVQIGPNNSRVVAKEGTNRKSFLVTTSELTNIQEGDNCGSGAPDTW